jgi:hypothetical protein
MISESELSAKIEQVTRDFQGQLDDLMGAVGLIHVGRVMGWRVVRLVGSRKHWMAANELFGDVKLLLPEETEYSDKSMGYRVVKASGRFWEQIKGVDAQMDITERRKVL